MSEDKAGIYRFQGVPEDFTLCGNRWTAHVVEILNVLDVTTESFENVREQLTAKVRGYDEELYLDALTGAYNRRYYENRIRKVRGHAGVAMIDLDDFKLYNDTCGHNAGDLVFNYSSREHPWMYM